MSGARARARGAPAPALPVEARVAALDWERIAAALDAEGCAIIGPVLSPDECRSLAATYDDDDGRFRTRIDMARHGFGRGE